MKNKLKIAFCVNGKRLFCNSLEEGDYIVGRAPEAKLSIRLPETVTGNTISREHLKLSVEKDKILLTNCGRGRTLYNGRQLEAPLVLEEGMELLLGETVLLNVLPENATVEVPDDNELASLSNGVTVKMNGETLQEFSLGTISQVTDGLKPISTKNGELASFPISPKGEPASTSSENEKNKDKEERIEKTSIFRTIILPLEKMLAWKRQQNVKDHKTYFYKKICWFFPVVLILPILLLQKKSPEMFLHFPENEEGKWQMTTYPAVGDEIALSFPKHHDAEPDIRHKEGEEPSCIRINTWCGRGKEEKVSLQIFFYEWQNKDVLWKTREELFDQYVKEVQKEECNLSNIFENAYIGAEQGLMTLECTYERKFEEKNWYGKARFFRSADRGFLLIAELPLEEKDRAALVIDNFTYMKFNPAFISNQWEGGESLGVSKEGKNTSLEWTTEQLEKDVKNILDHQETFAWKDAHLKLRTLLVQTGLDYWNAKEAGNKEAQRKCRSNLVNYAKQLRELRKQENIWFNKQSLRYAYAENIGDMTEQKMLLETAKMVFPSIEDQRNVLLNRGRFDW